MKSERFSSLSALVNVRLCFAGIRLIKLDAILPIALVIQFYRVLLFRATVQQYFDVMLKSSVPELATFLRNWPKPRCSGYGKNSTLSPSIPSRLFLGTSQIQPRHGQYTKLYSKFPAMNKFTMPMVNGMRHCYRAAQNSAGQRPHRHVRPD